MENGNRLPGNIPNEKLPDADVASELLVAVSIFVSPKSNATEVEANQGRQMYPDAPNPNDKPVASDSFPA